MTTPPWTRPYKKDGSEYDGSIPNTQLTSNKHYEKNWLSATHRVSLTSTGFVQITPIEGLNIKSQGGLEPRLAVTSHNGRAEWAGQCSREYQYRTPVYQ